MSARLKLSALSTTTAMTRSSEIPFRRLAVLSSAEMVHFYSVCSLFSYAGIMAVDLGWCRDEDAAGFVAGFLGSVTTLMRVPTAGLWGRFADARGTRLASCLSCAAIALGNALFGVCMRLWQALLVRGALLGGCNSVLTLLGPMSAEVAGDAHQTEVLSMVFGAARPVDRWVDVRPRRTLPATCAEPDRQHARRRRWGDRVLLVARRRRRRRR